MPDYNGHGFHQGDDGAVFGTTDGSATGSEGDYDLWDWKQIMAAVSGMSAGAGDDVNLSHARSVSDPRSLQDAANTYYRVQKSLEAVAKSLVDQAKALAGEDGPWKGPAADSFLDTMTTFSRQVAANAKVLSGGSTGRHSVPQQLANNAVTLRNARLKLAEIDTWYANRAQQLGLTPMSNGLIPISQKPELVRNMTEDMRTVLKSLASHYQFTSDTIVSPQPVPSPINTPDEHQGPGGDGPGGGPGPLPDPQGVGGDLPGGGDLASLAAGPGLDGLGGPGDLGAGPGGADGLDDLAGLGGPGGLSELGGPGGLNGAGLPDLPGLSFPGGLGLGPGGLAALDPGTFPGLGGLGGHGGLDKLGGLDGTDLGGLPALGTLGALGLGGLAGLGGPGAAGKGLAAGRGTVSGLAGFPRGLGLGGRADRTGEETAGEELQDGAGTATESSLPTGMGGAGMPFMPGMGGGAPAGRGDGSGERSDASGLLTPSTEPWEAGAESGEPEAGSGTGAAAGGEGLTAGGVPLVPAAGVAGAAGRSEEGTGARSEAAGLLDAGTEPWTAGAVREAAVLPGFGGPVTALAAGTATGTGTATAAKVAGAGAAAKGTATPPAAPAEAGTTASGSATATGPGDAERRTAVLPRPAAGGTEEDTALWERGAGAFVPLLWAAAPARHGQGEERPAEGSAVAAEPAEPWSTWQPDRTGGAAGGAGQALGAAVFGCGDGGPEAPASEEETVEAEEETAPRGVADLLLLDESTWGGSPDGSATTY
ncbi:hypothetical protein ACFWA9_27425 [Kitasatospora sp. NPDC059973]|uniref:hypothetical protein n=1 Tax=Kitasatospora sp. NPDC059973 TaxID=3347020 RepID=UPI00368D05F9